MTEWIEWHGGENPVPGKTVRTKLLNGAIATRASEEWNWRVSKPTAYYDIIAYHVIEDKESKTTMRTFETGATRDSNEDKLDYKGFLSMIAIKQFAEYMHSHRKQADGKLRASDNWKLGIDVSAYEESMTRHVFEWLQALEVGDRDKAFEIAPAIWFNLQGFMHEEGKLRQ